FFFQAEDGIRDFHVTGVQTCALPILVTVPLVIPPVVGGVALLLVLGRNGLLGRHLYEWTGLSLPFSTAAVVVAQVFVAMPFLVRSEERRVGKEGRSRWGPDE